MLETWNAGRGPRSHSHYTGGEHVMLRIEVDRIDCFASLILLALALIGCGRDAAPNSDPNRDRSQAADAKSQTAPPLPPEPWVGKEPKSWPQIVLTNEASFSGHTPLHGASSFLVRTHDNRILAATARHLIGSAGGVKPKVSPTEFNDVLQSWKVFPRTVPESFIEIKAIGPSGNDRNNCDWLTMKLKDSTTKLPAEPLYMSPKPAQVGDKVYLIGCPYTEPDCKQNVYVGRVTKGSFRIDFATISTHLLRSPDLAAHRLSMRRGTWSG